MQQATDRNNANDATRRGYGPEGVDKAPGEEPAQAPVPFTQESQKGKKVDADPSEPSDQPASQQDL